MLFKRFFVVLKPDDRAYCVDGGEADGFFKFERFGNRGRVTIYVTGLRQPVDFSYRGMLVGFKDNIPSVIDMGDLKVDDMGRCISQWIFDPDDIEGKGIGLNDLKVCAIAVDRLGGGLITPLVGIMDDSYRNWKEMIATEESELSQPEQENPEVEDSPPKPLEDTQEAEETVEKETMEEETLEEKEIEEKTIEEKAEEDEAQESDKDEKEKGEGDHHADTGEAKNIAESLELKDTGAPEESQYIRSLKEYISNIISHLQEVQPFEESLDGYRWWKVENGYAFDKDHYLMGLAFQDNKVKYIVYAMPGKFNAFDQPYGGLTGFVCWRPAKGQRMEYDADGYWLMHIDALTGQIAVPLKPTPPPLFRDYD